MFTMHHTVRPAAVDELDVIVEALDNRRGMILSSGVEAPGRYTRWDLGFVDPALVIEAIGGGLRIAALTSVGKVLVPFLAAAVAAAECWEITEEDGVYTGTVLLPEGAEELVVEEMRTRRPSVFTALREILAVLPADLPHLGLYGSFGYDLVRELERTAGQGGTDRDMVLYLPTSILAIDRARGTAERHEYTVTLDDGETVVPRAEEEVVAPFVAAVGGEPGSQLIHRDHQPGEYAALVEVAKESFARGDLFEVVPSQAFSVAMTQTPAAVFKQLQIANPSPYSALVNLGDNEFLITASPEMFVRVDGRRVETCPISGTIARGADALEDADQIQRLLESEKDRAELTMCTDVDRNDKSRVCIPGSVRVIGRRQIEMYSRVIHTVDHVEGTIAPEFDGIDAFVTHMWAVTVTGAPKLWAMRFVEKHERSPRRWYAGAVGALLANGDVNTGLTIRAAVIDEGIATVRAGGTLLFDSDPQAEELETELKAGALIDVLTTPLRAVSEKAVVDVPDRPGHRVLLVDHEDSFVLTLASYFRKLGAQVRTIRAARGHGPQHLERHLAEFRPTLVVLSPGPGRPDDFSMRETIRTVLEQDVALFGVCLGYQGIGEYFGARLDRLDSPLHGKERMSIVTAPGFLDGVPSTFNAGRYHSLHLDAVGLPGELVVVASDEEGVVTAIQHAELPIFGVQFHPESIMSAREDVGYRILDGVLQGALMTRAESR